MGRTSFFSWKKPGGGGGGGVLLLSLEFSPVKKKVPYSNIKKLDEKFISHVLHVSFTLAFFTGPFYIFFVTVFMSSMGV